jgi:phosphoglucosamine mutase
MTIDDLGIQVTRTGVGDNDVSEALRSGGDFGGEPSGAWIFPESSLCPDGIYAAAVLVDLVSKRKLSVLAGALTQYPIRRGSVKGIIDPGKFESALLKMLKPLTVQRIDGLKFNMEDGWVLVRVSGTEPKTRLTVEARTTDRANDIFEKVENLILESAR